MKGTCMRCGAERHALVTVSALTPDVRICMARTSCTVARKKANRAAREAGVETTWHLAERSTRATCPRCGRERHKQHMERVNPSAPQVLVCSARASCTTARRAANREARALVSTGAAQ